VACVKNKNPELMWGNLRHNREKKRTLGGDFSVERTRGLRVKSSGGPRLQQKKAKEGQFKGGGNRSSRKRADAGEIREWRGRECGARKQVINNGQEDGAIG